MVQQSIERLASRAPYLRVNYPSGKPVIGIDSSMEGFADTAAPASLLRLGPEPGKGFSRKAIEQMITALLLGRGNKIGLEALCDYWRQSQPGKLLTLDTLRELGRIIYNDAAYANDYALHSLVGMRSDQHVGVYPRDEQGIAWLKLLYQSYAPEINDALVNLDMGSPLFRQRLSFLTRLIEKNRNLLPWKGPTDPAFVESLILGHAWIRALLLEGLGQNDQAWLQKLKAIDLSTEYPKQLVLLGAHYRALWQSEMRAHVTDSLKISTDIYRLVSEIFYNPNQEPAQLDPIQQRLFRELYHGGGSVSKKAHDYKDLAKAVLVQEMSRQLGQRRLYVSLWNFEWLWKEAAKLPKWPQPPATEADPELAEIREIYHLIREGSPPHTKWAGLLEQLKSRVSKETSLLESIERELEQTLGGRHESGALAFAGRVSSDDGADQRLGNGAPPGSIQEAVAEMLRRYGIDNTVSVDPQAETPVTLVIAPEGNLVRKEMITRLMQTICSKLTDVGYSTVFRFFVPPQL